MKGEAEGPVRGVSDLAVELPGEVTIVTQPFPLYQQFSKSRDGASSSNG